MNTNELAYLTVINWPTSFNEDRRIEALVGSAAIDPFQAKLATRRNLPGVMCPINTHDRPHILNALHAQGVLCLAPSHDEIMAYPQAQTALGVQQFPDAKPASFVVETGDGEHWTFRADQVKLIVYGHIKSTSTTVDVDHNTPDAGGVAGSPSMSTQVRVNRNTKLTELLDLHIRTDDQSASDTPGQLKLVRLVGSRTRIGIVGDTARPSLLDNSRPFEMAQILMPDADIDTEFQDFDPPGIIRRQSQKKTGRSGSLTMESWAFYSPWVGIMKQSMYGW